MSVENLIVDYSVLEAVDLTGRLKHDYEMEFSICKERYKETAKYTTMTTFHKAKIIIEEPFKDFLLDRGCTEDDFQNYVLHAVAICVDKLLDLSKGKLEPGDLEKDITLMRPIDIEGTNEILGTVELIRGYEWIKKRSVKWVPE